MVLQVINYVDGNGAKQTQKAYFHLSELERARITAKYARNGQDFEDYLEELKRTGNVKVQLEMLEDIILSAYGVKTDDGQGFRKGRAVREEFEYSYAYAEFFEQLFANPEKFESFIKAVMAKNQVSDSPVVK